MIGKVLEYADLMEIAGFLINNKYDTAGISVEIPLDSDEMLEKINEDFFYRIEGNNAKLNTNVNEVIVNVGGINFRYFVKEQ
jgi:hypothetical protein